MDSPSDKTVGGNIEAPRNALWLGEYRVGRAQPGHWVIAGLGSCIGLILCDPHSKLFAMAHIVLPKASTTGTVQEPARFVNTAIPFLLDELIVMGARLRSIYAQVAGGARMLSLSALSDIGARNVEATRRLLQAYEIPLVAEIVGGTRGRTLWWYLDRGEAVVRQVGRDDKTLTPKQYSFGEVAVFGTNFSR